MLTLANQAVTPIKPTVVKPKVSRKYLDVNVILTFDMCNIHGDTQEFFDLKIPICSREKNAASFIHQKFFKRVTKFCARIGRDVHDLVKISTASNWNLFTEVTGKQSLPDLGHSCKWYFGNGRDDLDPWEQHLMKTYGFGSQVDMSWVKSETMDDYIKKYLQDRAGAQVI